MARVKVVLWVGVDCLLILVARAAKLILLVNDVLVGVRGVANQAWWWLCNYVYKKGVH